MFLQRREKTNNCKLQYAVLKYTDICKLPALSDTLVKYNITIAGFRPALTHTQPGFHSSTAELLRIRGL